MGIVGQLGYCNSMQMWKEQQARRWADEEAREARKQMEWYRQQNHKEEGDEIAGKGKD